MARAERKCGRCTSVFHIVCLTGNIWPISCIRCASTHSLAVWGVGATSSAPASSVHAPVAARAPVTRRQGCGSAASSCALSLHQCTNHQHCRGGTSPVIVGILPGGRRHRTFLHVGAPACKNISIQRPTFRILVTDALVG